MPEFSKEIVAAIAKTFTECDISYHYNGDGAFKLPFAPEEDGKNICLLVVTETDFMVFNPCYEELDPTNTRLVNRVCQYLHRCNNGIKNGCFEFDMDIGAIQYKTYVNCEDGLPNSGAIQNALFTSLSMVDCYYPGLLDVIHNKKTPEQAWMDCENRYDDESPVLPNNHNLS
ncbi:MAG: hypothetical protein HUJ58_01545 [Erysipelotrichaceae bacterium]|nr:hypothetical protein [Erysipelotrichaceae bacterium]